MIEDELSQLFIRRGWTWTISDQQVIPTAYTIKKVLDSAAEALYDEPVGTQMEVGRLIVRKETNTCDVYVMFGELESNNG